MRCGIRHVAALVASVALVAGGMASAAPMEPVNDDWDDSAEVDLLWADAGPGQAVAGQIFLDENYFNSSKIFAGGESCEGIDQGPCAEADAVVVQIVMPHCTADLTIDCVDELFVGEGGQRMQATAAGTFVPDGSSTFPPIELIDGELLPGSGELSLWRIPEYPHSGGDLYAVSMILSGVLLREADGWSKQPLEVSVQVMPVTRGAWNGEWSTCPDLDNQSGNECLVSSHRLPDEVFGTAVRVGPSFGSWVFGRVADLDIDVEEQRGQMLLRVSGRPAVTPHAAAGSLCESGTTFLGVQCPDFGFIAELNDAGSSFSLDAWRDWAAYVGPRSDALIRKWSFRASDAKFTSLEGCLEPGKVSGWISTNAMVFVAEPPKWNGATLDFSVGGPPLTPTGGRASADYEFFLRSSVADCLWPKQNITKQATVQVLDAGDTTEVATTSVGESEGWVRFVARNFGFPDVPQVRSAGPEARSQGRTPTISVAVAPKAKRFASCKALTKFYRDGVMRPGAENVVVVKGKRVKRPALGSPLVSAGIYAKNSRLDKDRDGLVCEREPKGSLI